MYFEDTRLYETITQTPFHKVAEKVRDLTDGGRDVNIRSTRGWTYLHLVGEYAEKYNDPRALPVAYTLALAGVDLRAQDEEGNTCLHVIALQKCEIPPWRLVIAFLRCGADPLTKNHDGATAEDLFYQGPHSDKVLHFLTKYTLGLWNEVISSNPNLEQVQNLVNSWFRVKLQQNGRTVSMVSAAEAEGACPSVISLLQKHEETNELALATLAGSCRKMKKILQAGSADIDTRDHLYQYYHPRSRGARPDAHGLQNRLLLETQSSYQSTTASAVPRQRDALSSHPPRTIASTVIDDADDDVMAVPVDVVAEADGDGAFSDVPDVQPGDPNYNMFENIDFLLSDPRQFPQVPQPLIVAAWEQENFDVIDLLMTYKPDVSCLYTNQETQEPKPLFFHTICGRPRLKNRRIVNLIINKADLSRKDKKGKTILWEAMVQYRSTNFINQLLDFGVDLSARDYKGRTARDYAESKGRAEYVPVLDTYVLNTVLKRDKGKLEGWVYRGYDHILDLIKADTELARKVVHKLGDNRLYRELASYIETIPSAQQMCRRLFRAIDGGEVKVLCSHMTPSQKKYVNKCGQTLLHRALLTRNHEVIEVVMERYSELAFVPDNMLRTPVHYCYLLYGGPEHPVTKTILDVARTTTDRDASERTPELYLKDSLPTHLYQTRLMEVTEYEGRILLREMDFDKQLTDIIKAGSSSDLKDLMGRAGKNADMSRYSQWLFLCVDEKQPELATQLIKYGCDPDVWRQNNPKKRQETTGQAPPVVSIQEHAKAAGFTKLTNFIEISRKNKTQTEQNAFEQMSFFEGS